MFLVEDVRQASPSQLEEQRRHSARRQKWGLATSKNENSPMICAAYVNEKFRGAEAVDIPIAPSEAVIPALPIHVPGNAKTVIKLVCKVCADHFHVEAIELVRKKRFKQIVIARQVAYLISRSVTEWSLPEVGRRFGGKDHTTVLHGIRKIQRKMAADETFAKAIEKLKATVLDRMHHTAPAVPGQCERGVSE